MTARETARRRTLERMRAAMALVVAVPLVAFAVTAALLYRNVANETEHRLNAVVQIVEEHALKVIDTNEMLLSRMLDLMGDRGDAYWLDNGRELHERLRAMAAGLPQVQGLFVNGADARMLGSNRTYPPARQIDYSDREYVVPHRSGQGPRIYFTGQLVSRATGERFFDMSRRRTLSDGTFAGSVHVSLRPEYFGRFWVEIGEATQGLRVALLRADGALLARFPGGVPEGMIWPADHPLMQRIRAGDAGSAFHSTSLIDRSTRLSTFRKLGEHPVYIAASFDRADVVGAWAREAGLLAAFTVPLVLALGWLSLRGYRRTRDELAAAARAEEESARLQQAELALAQAQRLETAGRLAGGVAHELNNLLMIVASHAHVLRLKAQAGTEPAGLAAIERAVASGRRLTRKLLALSGRQLLAPEHVNLQERLPAAVALLRAALPSAIEVELAVAADTAPIEVDPEELDLALINLALNARDAMPAGGRLAITARNAHEGVEILVNDSGRGIEPEILDRVREPLFTTKPPGLGSGLGLTQVQRLCEASGGALEIDSRPGTGTSVRLRFPAAAEAAADTAADHPAAGGLPALDCHVLLVEDDDSVAGAIASLLRSLGCRVERAGNADAALGMLARTRAEVVLSDIDMPGTRDGIALADALARRDPPVATVLISGHAPQVERALAAGYEALSKPTSAGALHEALSRARSRVPAA